MGCVCVICWAQWEQTSVKAVTCADHTFINIILAAETCSANSFLSRKGHRNELLFCSWLENCTFLWAARAINHSSTSATGGLLTAGVSVSTDRRSDTEPKEAHKLQTLHLQTTHSVSLDRRTGSESKLSTKAYLTSILRTEILISPSLFCLLVSSYTQDVMFGRCGISPAPPPLWLGGWVKSDSDERKKTTNTQRETDTQCLVFKYEALLLKYTGLWWTHGLRLPNVKWWNDLLVLICHAMIKVWQVNSFRVTVCHMNEVWCG